MGLVSSDQSVSVFLTLELNINSAWLLILLRWLRSWSSVWRSGDAFVREESLHGLHGRLFYRSRYFDYLGRSHFGFGPKSVLVTFFTRFQLKNSDYYSQYVTEDFNQYIKRKRKDNIHGNHIEIQALSELYNRPIEIYHYSNGKVGRWHFKPSRRPRTHKLNSHCRS